MAVYTTQQVIDRMNTARDMEREHQARLSEIKHGGNVLRARTSLYYGWFAGVLFAEGMAIMARGFYWTGHATTLSTIVGIVVMVASLVAYFYVNHRVGKNWQT